MNQLKDQRIILQKKVKKNQKRKNIKKIQKILF